MHQVAKVCIAAGSGLGMCSTGPAWATVVVVGIVVAGTVVVAKEMRNA